MHDTEELDPEEIAFNERINSIFLRKHEINFEDLVRQYRQVEMEFVERAGEDEYRIRETRRRISEWLLSEAEKTKQPHEVCTLIWDELVERGFSDPFLRHLKTSGYVRCCQMNGQFSRALEVHEPLIAEVEQWLSDTTLAPEVRAYLENDLAIDYKIRDELRANPLRPPEPPET